MEANDRVPVKNMIKALRKHYNMTQKDLAERSNVPLSTLKSWEQDVSKASVGELLQVANALHCSIDRLVRGEKMLLNARPFFEATPNLRENRRDETMQRISSLNITERLDNACCEDCYFWDLRLIKDTLSIGECHCNPPTVAPPSNTSKTGWMLWPETEGGDWCGQFIDKIQGDKHEEG